VHHTDGIYSKVKRRSCFFDGTLSPPQLLCPGMPERKRWTSQADRWIVKTSGGAAPPPTSSALVGGKFGSKLGQRFVVDTRG